MKGDKCYNCDAPEAMCFKKDDHRINVSFLYGEGLNIEGNSLNAIQITADETIGLKLYIER